MTASTPVVSASRPAVPTPVAAAAVAGVGAVAVAAVELGGTEVGPELCVIRRLTGGWCPGCGGARAARHVLHGDAVSAWADHPWVVFLAVQVMVFAAVWSVLAVTRRGRRPMISGSLLRAAVALNGVLLAAVWVVRVATGAIPTPF